MNIINFTSNIAHRLTSAVRNIFPFLNIRSSEDNVQTIQQSNKQEKIENFPPALTAMLAPFMKHLLQHWALTELQLNSFHLADEIKETCLQQLTQAQEKIKEYCNDNINCLVDSNLLINPTLTILNNLKIDLIALDDTQEKENALREINLLIYKTEGIFQLASSLIKSHLPLETNQQSSISTDNYLAAMTAFLKEALLEFHECTYLLSSFSGQGVQTLLIEEILPCIEELEQFLELPIQAETGLSKQQLHALTSLIRKINKASLAINEYAKFHHSLHTRITGRTAQHLKIKRLSEKADTELSAFSAFLSHSIKTFSDSFYFFNNDELSNALMLELNDNHAACKSIITLGASIQAKLEQLEVCAFEQGDCCLFLMTSSKANLLASQICHINKLYETNTLTLMDLPSLERIVTEYEVLKLDLRALLNNVPPAQTAKYLYFSNFVRQLLHEVTSHELLLTDLIEVLSIQLAEKKHYFKKECAEKLASIQLWQQQREDSLDSEQKIQVHQRMVSQTKEFYHAIENLNFQWIKKALGSFLEPENLEQNNEQCLDTLAAIQYELNDSREFLLSTNNIPTLAHFSSRFGNTLLELEHKIQSMLTSPLDSDLFLNNQSKTDILTALRRYKSSSLTPLINQHINPDVFTTLAQNNTFPIIPYAESEEQFKNNITSEFVDLLESVDSLPFNGIAAAHAFYQCHASLAKTAPELAKKAENIANRVKNNLAKTFALEQKQTVEELFHINNANYALQAYREFLIEHASHPSLIALNLKVQQCLATIDTYHASFSQILTDNQEVLVEKLKDELYFYLDDLTLASDKFESLMHLESELAVLVEHPENLNDFKNNLDALYNLNAPATDEITSEFLLYLSKLHDSIALMKDSLTPMLEKNHPEFIFHTNVQRMIDESEVLKLSIQRFCSVGIENTLSLSQDTTHSLALRILSLFSTNNAIKIAQETSRAGVNLLLEAASYLERLPKIFKTSEPKTYCIGDFKETENTSRITKSYQGFVEFNGRFEDITAEQILFLEPSVVNETELSNSSEFIDARSAFVGMIKELNLSALALDLILTKESELESRGTQDVKKLIEIAKYIFATPELRAEEKLLEARFLKRLLFLNDYCQRTGEQSEIATALAEVKQAVKQEFGNNYKSYFGLQAKAMLPDYPPSAKIDLSSKQDIKQPKTAEEINEENRILQELEARAIQHFSEDSLNEDEDIPKKYIENAQRNVLIASQNKISTLRKKYQESNSPDDLGEFISALKKTVILLTNLNTLSKTWLPPKVIDYAYFQLSSLTTDNPTFLINQIQYPLYSKKEAANVALNVAALFNDLESIINFQGNTDELVDKLYQNVSHNLI